MNPGISYGNRGADARAIEVSRVVPYGLLLAGVLVAGAGCAARPVVISPPKVVHPTLPRVEALERTVRETQGNYAELKGQFDAYRAEAERKVRELQGNYGTLKEGQDGLQVRVEAVEQTQTRILDRALNEASILISKIKTGHAEVYSDLFRFVAGGFADDYRQAAGLHGTHIYLVPLISGDYNLHIVSDVKSVGNLVFIGRYHRPAPGVEAVKVPRAIKEKIPEGVLQQSLDIRIVKPIKLPGRDDLNVPAQRQAPRPKPFNRAQNEKYSRPNGHRPRKAYHSIKR